MRLQKIGLGDKDLCYGLVPYSADLENRLLHMHLSDHMIEMVKLGLDRYQMNENIQSYLLAHTDKGFVGGIVLVPSDLHKNFLSVHIELSDFCFMKKSEQLCLLEDIVSAIRLYYYKYDGLDIFIEGNAASLGIPYFSKDNSCPYKDTFARIFAEMQGAEQNLISWGVSYTQFLLRRDGAVDSFDFDHDLVGNELPPDEYFNKHEAVVWENIKSRNCEREITFYDTGSVVLKKENVKKGAYSFDYSLFSDDFHMSNTAKHMDVRTCEGTVFCELNGVIAEFNQTDESMKFKLTNPFMEMQLSLDEDGCLNFCEMLFHTYKYNDEKRNGTYRFRMDNGFFDFSFISRKGLHYRLVDAKEQLLIHQKLEQLRYAKIDSDLMIALVEYLISVANSFATKNQRTDVQFDIDWLSHFDVKKIVREYFKEIKGEIPLPHLKRNIELFIEKLSRDKKSQSLVREKKTQD